jgi:metacaspase-1
MAKGISLHIGLNSVDPDHYEGWDGALNACEFDAKDMQALAKKQKFGSSKLLLTNNGTSAAVSAAMSDAAKRLSSGDIFFLTYSGHGGQVPDTNQDEPDRRDETWVLYDRQLVDDELYGLYAKFKAGVRIMVLSDSCHSGTVTRAVPPFLRGGPRQKFMPQRVGERVYKAHKKQYDAIQAKNKAAEAVTPKATILLISGCQDNQVSLDGSQNGLFTQMLKKVWNGGKFQFGYRRFRDTIVTQMPATQTPNYFVVGAANSTFENQKPFTV